MVMTLYYSNMNKATVSILSGLPHRTDLARILPQQRHEKESCRGNHPYCRDSIGSQRDGKPPSARATETIRLPRGFENGARDSRNVATPACRRSGL